MSLCSSVALVGSVGLLRWFGLVTVSIGPGALVVKFSGGFLWWDRLNWWDWLDWLDRLPGCKLLGSFLSCDPFSFRGWCVTVTGTSHTVTLKPCLTLYMLYTASVYAIITIIDIIIITAGGRGRVPY